MFVDEMHTKVDRSIDRSTANYDGYSFCAADEMGWDEGLKYQAHCGITINPTGRPQVATDMCSPVAEK